MAPPAVNSSPFSRATLLLIGLAWTAPFLQPYHRFPLTAFYSEWLAFALGLAAASLLLRKESWRDAAVPAVVFAPLGLVLVLGLQVMLGRVPYPEQALVAALYLLWAALMMVLGLALRRDLGLAPVAAALAWFVLAGGLLSALAGLLQHFHLSTPLDPLIARKVGSLVYGNLGHNNHFAAYLTMALAAVAYLYGRGRLHGALTTAYAALMLLMLALSGSRSPWLYLCMLAAFALLMNHLQGGTESRRLAVAALCLLPGFVAAQWVAILPFMIPAEGTFVTSAERLFLLASGVDSRLQLAREAWGMVLDAPALGAGWGQFAWHHYQYQAVTGATAAPGVFNHSHNIVFQLLAETGLVGALIVVAAVLAWIADLRHVRFDPAWWWLLALLAVIGTHSLLEYPLWYAYFLGMAALLLGLGAERLLAVRFAGAARAAVALGLLAGCVNLIAVLPPYRDFERLVFDAGSKTAQALSGREFAESMMRVHREPLLTPYVELALALAATVDRVELHEKVELTSRAMHFAPVDVVVYRHALLLALAGSREAAREQLERSLRVYPGERAAVVAELEELVRRHPSELTPLLELAAENFEERRASQERK